MNLKKHRQMVAKKRGESWRKSLKEGRKLVKENPSSLRKARDKNNLTSVDMSEKTGINRSSYQEIESGRRMVKAEAAKTIASVLKMPLKNLFKEEMFGRYRVKGGHNSPTARK